MPPGTARAMYACSDRWHAARHTKAATSTSSYRWNPAGACLTWGGLLIDLQNLLGCSVDVVSEGGLRARFRSQVEQEAIAL